MPNGWEFPHWKNRPETRRALRSVQPGSRDSVISALWAVSGLSDADVLPGAAGPAIRPKPTTSATRAAIKRTADIRSRKDFIISFLGPWMVEVRESRGIRGSSLTPPNGPYLRRERLTFAARATAKVQRSDGTTPHPQSRRAARIAQCTAVPASLPTSAPSQSATCGLYLSERSRSCRPNDRCASVRG